MCKQGQGSVCEQRQGSVCEQDQGSVCICDQGSDRAGGRHEPSWPQELTAVPSHPQANLPPRLWSEV